MLRGTSFLWYFFYPTFLSQGTFHTQGSFTTWERFEVKNFMQTEDALILCTPLVGKLVIGQVCVFLRVRETWARMCASLPALERATIPISLYQSHQASTGVWGGRGEGRTEAFWDGERMGGRQNHGWPGVKRGCDQDLVLRPHSLVTWHNAGLLRTTPPSTGSLIGAAVVLPRVRGINSPMSKPEPILPASLFSTC